MKIRPLLLTLLIIVLSQLNLKAQSVFHTGYLRFGINTLGSKLNNTLSPKDNIFTGNYGAGTGYVFEFGRIFYFSKKAADKKIAYGLDWTMLSFSYNKLDKWDSYAAASGAEDYDIDGSKIAGAISTKIGPVISFNPIEKLVIDARVQLIPVVRFFDLNYNENAPNQRSFTFQNYGREDTDENFDAEKITNRLAFGVATGFGLTVRRGVVGVSFDYISGKVSSNYDAYDGETNHTFGKEKIPAHNMQIKFNFAF